MLLVNNNKPQVSLCPYLYVHSKNVFIFNFIHFWLTYLYIYVL